jgi:hypothetical protein
VGDFSMKNEEKLKLIESEIDDRVREFARKRKGDKRWAFGLKVAGVSLAAIITVLLGLQLGDEWSGPFKNIALVLGALITVFNAYEAFYDYRALWVRRTVTLVNLYKLQRDFRFYKSGVEPAEISNTTLERFKNRLDEIMDNDLRNWLKLRDADPEQLEAQTLSNQAAESKGAE